MSDAHAVALALVKAGAVTLTEGPEGEDGAPSGGLALDVTRLSSHPQLRGSVRGHLVRVLEPLRAEFDLIVSPNIASLPLATMAASALGLPMAYLRAKPKAHGRRQQVEGRMPPGSRALLLFDAILSERPVVDAREIVQANGGVVPAGVCLVAGVDGPLHLTTQAAVREALVAVAGEGPTEQPRRSLRSRSLAIG